MSTEVIANLWTFVRKPFAYEVGMRLYMVSGNDDDKFAFLNAFAPFDFHFAHRYPIPKGFTVHLTGTGGPPIERSGLMVPNPAIEYLDCFQDAWEPLESSLPVHPIGSGGKTSAKAPLQTNNLLNVHTYVEVDEQGRQVAKVTNPQFSGQPAKLLLSRWAFADEASSRVFALAARAYLAVGNESQLDRLLAALAPDDYLLARRMPVASGSAVQAADVSSDKTLFNDVLRDLQQNVPVGYVDWVRETTAKYAFRPEDATARTTVVTENQQAKVRTAPPTASAGSSSQPAQPPKPWWKFW